MAREIKITKEEAWASNTLNREIMELKEAIQRAVAAREPYMALLDTPYNAGVPQNTGRLEPKPKEEPKGK